MLFVSHYPIDLKLKVLSEYEQGTCGYKYLARKYGLTRDIVRYWVLSAKSKGMLQMMDSEPEDSEEKDIEYYKAEAAYWKAYAKKIEQIKFPDNKKKQQSKQSRNCSREDSK